ncbi:MAG: V-type ATP synthase subunit I, partial [Halobacteriaceae archaeon]
MLRPEQMSKVSVTGTRAILEDFIEAIHDQNVVHLSDYDGNIEGFDHGNPTESADAAAEKLVTVRSVQSILGVTEEDAGPTRIVTDEALDDQLERIRSEVNELDEERSALEDEYREMEERIEAADPFVELGIDLEYLSGYDNLEVAVGEAEAEPVQDALARGDNIRAYDVFEGEDIVAAFVYPSKGHENVIDDALVGVDFTHVEVPNASGSPEDYIADLQRERAKLERNIEELEAELEALRLEHADFLLAAEEKLTIEVQKAEAPLQFATTQRAFVGEGWIPTSDYTEFASAIRDAL